jgi:GTP-binding protein
MFIDSAKLEVKAGNGGNGAVSFRREKYVPYGGPNGGNGGRGGSIFFVASTNISTLADFRFNKTIKAPNGENGGIKNMFGAAAEDVYINVPVGTLVYLEPEHLLIADFKEVGETKLIAKGGRGGRGNVSFKSSTNRVPKIAENGIQGEKYSLSLELKLLADVGFVGLPNAGKSTLLSVISDARPEIGDYPFTTLTPQLGVVYLKDGRSFVAADLPGLIKGASQGKGLGLRFLKHIERCRVIVMVIDFSGPNDPYDDYQVLKHELTEYGFNLTTRPIIIAASKVEDEDATTRLKAFRKRVRKHKTIGISSILHEGIDDLLYKVADTLQVTPEVNLIAAENELSPSEIIYDARKDESLKPFVIEREQSGVFRIKGLEVENRYRQYSLTTDEAILRLLSYLREIGVEKELERLGAKDGDKVILLDFEFTYYQ